jgi:hypothetical protein
VHASTWRCCALLRIRDSFWQSHHIVHGDCRQRSQAGDGSGNSLITPCVPSMLEDPWRQLIPRPSG